MLRPSHRVYPYQPIPIHPYLHYPYPIRQLPEVKPDQFVKSAQSSMALLTDANTLITRFQSRDYARRVMQAAQASNSSAVNELLRTSGIKTSQKLNIIRMESHLILTIRMLLHAVI